MFDDDDVRLLPVPRPEGDDAVHQLWLTVLALGLQDAAAALVRPRVCSVLPVEAVRGLCWVLDDTVAVGSFAWVCTVLDMAPDAVRRCLCRRCGVTGQRARDVAYAAPAVAA
jgi:hypothetical protein